MSFGCGIGDVLAVSKLALDIWSRVRNAPDQFKAIRNEFRGFYNVLEDAAQDLSGLELNQKQTERLASLLQGCQAVLDDTNAVLEKFARLGVKSSSLNAMTKKAWKKVTWDEKSISDRRGRIVLSTSLFNTFTVTVTCSTVQSVKDTVTVTDGRVQDLQSYNDEQERRRILNWISSHDFSSQQSAILDKREKGTGQWLLESREYQEWMSNNQATPLCVGMPGAGKTMLASIAINFLVSEFRKEQDVGVAYIYCDYKTENEQTPLNLLACLLKQLLEQKLSKSEDIRFLYKQHNDGTNVTRPTLNEMLEILQLTATSFSQVYIIVDALDELPQHGNTFPVFMSNICALQATASVNLLLTSRDLPRVLDQVGTAVRLEVRASDEDVLRYVDGHIDELPKFVSRSPKTQQSIKDAIVSAVDGMFLLARLHLDSLVDKMNTSEAGNALETLPTGKTALSMAYDQAMQRIEAQKPGIRRLAGSAISWIFYAKRLLSVVELRYALGVRHETSAFDEKYLCDIDDIVSACGGLIVVDQGRDTDTVRLVHYSTQEFLKETGKRYFPDAQRNIATSCLTYLSYDCFKEGWHYDPSVPWDLQDRHRTEFLGDFVQRYPLVSYAGHHWAPHASESLEQPIEDLMIQFLKDDYNVSSAAQVLYGTKLDGYIGSCNFTHSDSRFWLDTKTRNPMSGMRLAICCGITDVVLVLLDNDFLADVRDAYNRSPLFCAALIDHTAVVELLLSLNNNNRIDRNRIYLYPESDCLASAVDIEPATQLTGLQGSVGHRTAALLSQATSASRASDAIHEVALHLPQMVPIIDVNCQDRDGNTPLAVAAEHGHDEVVAQLLEQADILPNLASANGTTPLISAAGLGHEAVVELLIAHADVDVNIKRLDGQTALYAAIEAFQEAVVQVLLSHADIDVNGEPDQRCVPLIAATSCNSRSMVKLLLTHQLVDLGSKTKDGKTAAAVAASYGYEATVKLLMTYDGIDWNSIDMYGGTPLSEAVFGWLERDPRLLSCFTSADLATNEATAKLLIARSDVDIECMDTQGNNLLSRVTKFAQRISEPRLDGVIALLRAAMEDRSRGISED